MNRTPSRKARIANEGEAFRPWRRWRLATVLRVAIKLQGEELMAEADYWLCDVCDGKTFYDAGLDYDGEYERSHDHRMLPAGAGDMAVICIKCAETHEITWRPKPVRGSLT